MCPKCGSTPASRPAFSECEKCGIFEQHQKQLQHPSIQPEICAPTVTFMYDGELYSISENVYHAFMFKSMVALDGMRDDIAEIRDDLSELTGKTRSSGRTPRLLSSAPSSSSCTFVNDIRGRHTTRSATPEEYYMSGALP